MSYNYFCRLCGEGKGPQAYWSEDGKRVFDPKQVRAWRDKRPWAQYKHGQNPKRASKNLVSFHMKLEPGQLALFRKKFPGAELGPFIRNLLCQTLH